MEKKEMTDEQRYWYLKGYIDCFSLDLSIERKITEEEARRMLGELLSRSVKALT